MKKLLYIVILSVSLFACEDVIDVDLPVNSARLNVDALIRIDIDSPTTTFQVKTNLTNSFFEEVQPAEIESITITNQDYVPASTLDQNFISLVQVAPGTYEGFKNTDFFTSGVLELNITHNDQMYSATTTFVPSSPIISLEQGDGTLFTGNETEVKITFTDDETRHDFYLVDLDFEDYLVTEDEFYNGQTFNFSYFYDENVEAGSIINISLLGIDEPFFNYMNQLIVQAGGNQGPFQTPVATVRGNLINITSTNEEENTANFALGYFSVNQAFKASITLQ